MPIHLPPISRRRFLASSLAAAVAAAMGRRGFAAGEPGKVDPNRFALLSDAHLAADTTLKVRDVDMHANFLRVQAEVLAGDVRPAAVLFNGDLAYDAGTPADYRVVVDAVKPFREVGLPVYMSMGNHDDRANFWAAVPPAEAKGAVDAKQVAVVESPLADWVMLDSLEATKKTPGLLGPEQLAWLGKVLDARKEKPCLVMVHHNPDRPDVPKVAGIKDTAALMAELLPRKQVKALLFGHTHVWMHAEVEGLHLVNLPPTAYAFKAGSPSGWVDCQLATGGAKLTLRALDPKHPLQGQVLNLKWRA